MKGKGLFVVRAVVGEDERAAFDDWYEREHLPDAVARFGAETAWRCWSRTDPGVHTAYYVMRDVSAAEGIPSNPGMKVLIADFDARWGDRVTRAREILDCVGAFTPA